MKVLVTGGAGYLGGTFCCALKDNRYEPIVLDSLISGDSSRLKERKFYLGDVADRDILSKIFEEQGDIPIAIHCAERASVSLSVNHPYEYYSLNVVRSMELFKNLCDLGCKKIIFASSAAIYDDVPGYMVTERSTIKPRSPFARTKYMTEMILKDFCSAYDMKCISLRYFNPIGADPNGRCGLNEKSPTNIIGNLLRIFNGETKTFKISGNDWETRDGTCMRDYIHVWDAALANVKAVENFDAAFERVGEEYENFLPINIGSGVGVTVQEFIFAFENVTREKVNVIYGPRRLGDIGGSYANVSLAKQTIDWKAERSVEEAIIDAINWEEKKKK